MLRVHRHPSAAAFLGRAEPWLMEAEAEHNLVLGLAQQLSRTTDPQALGYMPPILWATVEEAGAVVGCAFRTPPFKLGLTRMPEAALPLVVKHVAELYEALPAVLGPEQEAQRFGALWSARRGVEARAGMRQRIYQLEAVVPPPAPPSGRLRPATAEDVDRLLAWMRAFEREAGVPVVQSRVRIEERVEQEALFLWDDEGPVSMAGHAGRTPNGVRVGPVYTPPERRGRGYGTAATAALSRRLLDGGARFCVLYTDRANPTSNSIYERIGYRPVCDVLDVEFEG